MVATRFTDDVHSDTGFTVGDPEDPTPVGPLEPATEADIGGVKQMPAMADVGTAPTQANFNALLAALRAAGMMATS